MSFLCVFDYGTVEFSIKLLKNIVNTFLLIRWFIQDLDLSPRSRTKNGSTCSRYYLQFFDRQTNRDRYDIGWVMPEELRASWLPFTNHYRFYPFFLTWNSSDSEDFLSFFLWNEIRVIVFLILKGIFINFQEKLQNFLHWPNSWRGVLLLRNPKMARFPNSKSAPQKLLLDGKRKWVKVRPALDTLRAKSLRTSSR